jgi:hypothetical protein
MARSCDIISLTQVDGSSRWTWNGVILAYDADAPSDKVLIRRPGKAMIDLNRRLAVRVPFSVFEGG